MLSAWVACTFVRSTVSVKRHWFVEQHFIFMEGLEDQITIAWLCSRGVCVVNWPAYKCDLSPNKGEWQFSVLLSYTVEYCYMKTSCNSKHECVATFKNMFLALKVTMAIIFKNNFNIEPHCCKTCTADPGANLK